MTAAEVEELNEIFKGMDTRLAREQLNLLAQEGGRLGHSVKFITVKDGIDTTTPLGEAMMYLAVIFSGLEVQTDSLRITDNMIHLAAKGFWCGGPPPQTIILIVLDGAKLLKVLLYVSLTHRELHLGAV